MSTNGTTVNGNTTPRAAAFSEREALRDELERTRRQLERERNNNEPLKRQIHDLRLKVAEGDAELRRKIATLTEEVKDLSAREKDRTQEYLDGVKDASLQMATNERLIMAQQIETWKTAAEKWKAEAMRAGNETIGLCYQASVDEAVRKEREKDSFLMKSMQKEIDELKKAAGKDC